MKQLFPIATVVLTAFCSAAMSPREWVNKQIFSISPNGSYSASEYHGSISLINNENCESVELMGDEDAGYSLGAGNSVSNNGITVGAFGNNPGYLKDGEWHNLRTRFPQNPNRANGITPDGSRICGTVGTASPATEDSPAPIQSPAVWDLRKDGTYSEPTMLPYPPLDYTGRVPLCVTALSISDDGKTIVGLVTDYTGAMNTLISYTFKDNKWVMHNEFQSLANPNSVNIPKYPGKCPEAPQIIDYMTENERRVYQEALDAWYAAGTFDYATYPDINDFITDEEKAIYDAALSEWQTNVYTPWQAAIDAFDTAVKECNGTTLTLNNAIISPDGKTAVSTAVITVKSPNSPLGVSYHNKVMAFNLKDNTHKVFNDRDMNASAIANNGEILAFSKTMDPERAWIYLPGDIQDPVSVMEYVHERDEQSYKWMQECMAHDFETTDPDNGKPVTLEDYEFTGVPICSKDMSVISCMVRNVWDYTTDANSYIIPINRPDSVKDITNDSETKTLIFKEGRIIVEGNAQSVCIFDLNGRMVFTTTETSGTISTGLTSGTYIVKVTTPDGVQTRKATF